MRRTSAVLDGAGASLSGLCLAHCLAPPLLAAALPTLGGWAGPEWVHAAVVALAAPVAILALARPGHGLAPSPWLITTGILGLALMTLGAFGPSSSEEVASIAGGIALALAHILNWKRRNRCGAGLLRAREHCDPRSHR